MLEWTSIGEHRVAAHVPCVVGVDCAHLAFLVADERSLSDGIELLLVRLVRCAHMKHIRLDAEAPFAVEVEQVKVARLLHVEHLVGDGEQLLVMAQPRG